MPPKSIRPLAAASRRLRQAAQAAPAPPFRSALWHAPTKLDPSRVLHNAQLAEMRRVVLAGLRVLYGGACQDCGASGRLHFHHVDPTTKLFAVGDRSHPLRELIAEAKKCRLLCVPCHQAAHRVLARKDVPHITSPAQSATGAADENE